MAHLRVDAVLGLGDLKQLPPADRAVGKHQTGWSVHAVYSAIYHTVHDSAVHVHDSAVHVHD